MAVQGDLVRPYTFGRPSKLTNSLLDQARKYVTDSDNMSVHTLLPTKERLALTLGITRETLDIWAKENKDFSDICKHLDLLQADKAMQNGLMGRYQPAITAIVLSRHGYVRKEEVDNKHEMVQPIMKLEEQHALPGNNSDPQG